jgi:outer membrane protein
MKQASLVLNAVLLIAVGILYYLHFSSRTTPVKKASVAAASSSAAQATANGKPAIAYVDLDSLNEKITYIKNKRKEFESRQESIERTWESGMRGLEAEKNAFMKKHGESTMTKELAEEAELLQGNLLRKQQQIETVKQTESQKLSEESFKFLENVQKKLKDFLATYNEDKQFMYIFTTGTGLDYMAYKDSTLNITDDVILGMNEVLAPKK